MGNLLNREKKINEIEALKNEKLIQENKNTLINEIKLIPKEEFAELTTKIKIDIKKETFFSKIIKSINIFFNKF